MSDPVKLRKYVATVEETHHDGGPVLVRPVTKAVVGGVIANPYAGRHVADIQPLMKSLESLAVDLTERVLKLLGAKGADLEAYGKGAIVGLAGELEHAALWHQPSGFGIRHAFGNRLIQYGESSLAFLNQANAFAQHFALGIVAAFGDQFGHEFFERFAKVRTDHGVSPERFIN